ncbi:MAG: protein kinase [Anaerolineae bacterium]|nr:protein kinase [Anaerolineae bacterium]
MGSENLVGQVIDGYRIDQLLGEGGMAQVYRAIDERLTRYVALKVIQPAVQIDDSYRARFEREARAIAQLQHPNIVSIYRFGEVGQRLYMAMEYVDGADLHWVLQDYARDKELLPPDDALMVLSQAAQALDYAHSKGVIHRDIKPANIMMDRSGRVVLTDFGLALISLEGTKGEVFGTPQYIAPEQAVNSAGATAQSDQYALGVILYEILTGSVPYGGKSAMHIALAHMTEPLPDPRTRNPDLHPALVDVLQRVLAKEPTARYPSCAALVEAFEAAYQASKAAPPSSSSRVSLMRVKEQVDEYQAANPLPPLPAAVMRAVPTPVTPAAAAPTVPPSVMAAAPPPMPSSAPTRPPLPKTKAAPSPRKIDWRVTGIASAVMVALGVVIVVWLLSGRPPDGRAFALATVPPTIPVALDTAAPSTTPLPPSPEPSLTASPEPSATPTPAPTDSPPIALPTRQQVWEVLLLAERDHSLYVINDSAPDMPPMPLYPLILGAQERGGASGEDFSVDTLASGECVRLDRRDNARTPDTDCTLLGRFEVRQGNLRFWKPEFQFIAVIYGQTVAECRIRDAHEDGCRVEIPVQMDG